MMKAKTIIDAIISMREMDDVTYTTSPEEWARKLNHLQSAMIELQIELGQIGITVEEEKELNRSAESAIPANANMQRIKARRCS